MSEADAGYFAGTVAMLIAVAFLYAIGAFGWPALIGMAICSAILAWCDHRKWKREQRQ